MAVRQVGEGKGLSEFKTNLLRRLGPCSVDVSGTATRCYAPSSRDPFAVRPMHGAAASQPIIINIRQSP